MRTDLHGPQSQVVWYDSLSADKFKIGACFYGMERKLVSNLSISQFNYTQSPSLFSDHVRYTNHLAVVYFAFQAVITPSAVA